MLRIASPLMARWKVRTPRCRASAATRAVEAARRTHVRIPAAAPAAALSCEAPIRPPTRAEVSPRNKRNGTRRIRGTSRFHQPRHRWSRRKSRRTTPPRRIGTRPNRRTPEQLLRQRMPEASTRLQRFPRSERSPLRRGSRHRRLCQSQSKFRRRRMHQLSHKELVQRALRGSRNYSSQGDLPRLRGPHRHRHTVVRSGPRPGRRW
jgi:hypothetical protein